MIPEDRRAAVIQVGKTVEAVERQLGRLSDTVSGLTIDVGVVSRMLREEVLPEVRDMPRHLADAIKGHESTCPLLVAATEKLKKDVARSLSAPGATPAVREKLITRRRLIQAAAGIIIAAISAVSAWLAA